MRARLIPALFTVVLAGCTAKVTGEPFGKKLETPYASASRGSDSFTAWYTVVIANDVGNECGDSAKGVVPDGTFKVVVTIARHGKQLPLSRGTPYLQGGEDEWAGVSSCQVTDGQCVLVPMTEASVTMTGATDAMVTGTFTAKIGEQDVSGNFGAPICRL